MLTEAKGVRQMNRKEVDICVYGAESICPSCVNLPSSKETFEWLEAAIKRKFPHQSFKISYVDIHQPPDEEFKRIFAKRIIDEEMFYPVVLMEDKIIGEGNPKLKLIFAEMERYGYGGHEFGK
jgi:disulfide oxidoreductase YuzD